MSRFEDYYDGDADVVPPQLWRRNLKLALEGDRGQAVLRELREALLAMPVKEIAHETLFRWNEEEGTACMCALGALLHHRLQRGTLREKRHRIQSGSWRKQFYYYTVQDEEDLQDSVSFAEDMGIWGTMDAAEKFGITRMLAYAIARANDEDFPETASDAERYRWMLQWVERQIKET